MKDERASQTATHQEEDQVIIIDPPDANDGVIEKVDCPGVRSVKDWESIFLNSWQSSHSGEYLARSTSPDSWKYYNLAYAMDANVAIWQATADVKYLNRALLYVQNVMALATQSPGNNFNDTYLGWAQHTHPTMGDNNNEYPLFESYMWRYVTRMLRLMKLAGMSESSSPYRTQYKSVLDFTEKHIWEKWKSRGMTHLYRSRTHMAAHWMAIGLDLMVTTEDVSLRPQYQEVFDAIAFSGMPNYKGASINGQLMTHPTLGTDAYFFDWIWNGTSRPGSDVSHGGNTIASMVEVVEVGAYWNEADMLKLINTLDKAIWRGSKDYAAYVDGSGNGNGWFNEGWVKLGRYDIALQKRLQSHTVGQGIQLSANGALNAKLLFDTRCNELIE